MENKIKIRKLSRELNSFLFSEELLDLLPGCGWNDGGCRSLMKAMTIWLGEVAEPYLIVSQKHHQHASHAFVRIGNYFVDGDGISTRQALYQRWRRAEHFPSVYIKPFNPLTEPNTRSGETPFYIEDSGIIQLIDLLQNKFDKNYILQLLLTE